MGPPKPPRRPNIRWNDYMRQVLCCLYRFYFRENKTWEEIFSKMFRSRLDERGIHGFLPFTTMCTQWTWMRDHGNLVWYHVHIATSFTKDGEWKDIISKINSTAQQLRLQIREKKEDNVDTSLWRPSESTSALRTRPAPSVVILTNTALNRITPEPQRSPETPQRMTLALHQTTEQETSNYWANNDSQSDSETMVATVSHSHEQIAYPGSDEPVVISHGKVCLWCEQGSEVDYQDDQPDQDQHDQGQRDQGQYDQGQYDQGQYDQGQYDQNQHDQNQHDQDQHEDQQELNENDQSQQHPGQGHHHQIDDGMQGVTMSDLPPLLYRWSNCDSQGINTKKRFRAGFFCNREYFDPEDCHESGFESFFRSHVTKERVQTPFISTFRSPLAPIHRAITSQKGAIVTIIDTSRLETKVFYALPLAIRTRTFTHSWKGYGEYLIWSHIPKEAIALTLEISSLEQIARGNRDINRLLQLPLIRSVPRCNQQLRAMLTTKRKPPFKSGCTLAKLLTLLHVEKAHWEHIAEIFAKTWGWKNKGERRLFIEGVQREPIDLGETLSDSESEAPWPVAQKPPDSTSKKLNLASDSLSDLDYEPPDTEQDSEGSSDEEGPSDYDTQSIPMDDRTETVDDDNFSTHETDSSGVFQDDRFEDVMNDLPQIAKDDRTEHQLLDFLYRGSDHHLEQTQTRAPETESIDLTLEDNRTGPRLPNFLHQTLDFRLEQTQARALEPESIDLTLEDDDWPSDDRYHITPTPSQRRVPRQPERDRGPIGDRMDVEKAPQIQLWSFGGWRENPTS